MTAQRAETRKQGAGSGRARSCSAPSAVLAGALVLAAVVPDVREGGIGVRLGKKGVITVSDPPHASPGPDTAVDEYLLEELIIEAQTDLPFELPVLANRCPASRVSRCRDRM